MSEEDRNSSEGKGRQNAILTYEQVARMSASIVRVETKLDAITAGQTAAEKAHMDHEVRLRALELTQAAYIASTTSSRGVASWIWTAAMGLILVLIAVLNYLGIHPGTP